MDSFSPVSALAGGLLIGAAASLLLWLNGRIAGLFVGAFLHKLIDAPAADRTATAEG